MTKIISNELKYLSKDIRETFGERIVNNFFVFSLTDVHFEKTVYDLDLLPPNTAIIAFLRERQQERWKV